MATGRAQVVRVTLVSAIVVLAAAGGSLLFTETASVTISVPRQNLEALVTLAGGPGGGVDARVGVGRGVGAGVGTGMGVATEAGASLDVPDEVPVVAPGCALVEG